MKKSGAYSPSKGINHLTIEEEGPSENGDVPPIICTREVVNEESDHFRQLSPRTKEIQRVVNCIVKSK
jgi:hypothetical protein